MNFLNGLNFANGLLNNPGDSIVAEKTKTNREVIKINKPSSGIKMSATRYPSTGTTVKTIVEKKKDE